jgi:hypothetical protein
MSEKYHNRVSSPLSDRASRRSKIEVAGIATVASFSAWLCSPSSFYPLGDPLKPATSFVGAQACRINDRCSDRLARLPDEAVGAVDLIRDFRVGHHASSSRSSPR